MSDKKTPKTIGEIGIVLSDLDDKIYSNFIAQNEKLDRIEIQAKTTNGRVGRVELWRSYILGGLTVITMFLVPVLVWSILVLVDMDNRIHAAIQQELSRYEINIQ